MNGLSAQQIGLVFVCLAAFSTLTLSGRKRLWTTLPTMTIATGTLASSQPSAAARTFGVYELLEQILQHLSAKAILRCREVCRDWHAVIFDSPTARLGLFLNLTGFQNPATGGTVTCRGTCRSSGREGKRCAQSRNIIVQPAIERLKLVTGDRRIVGERLGAALASELQFICCMSHRNEAVVDEMCALIARFRNKELVRWERLPERIEKVVEEMVEEADEVKQEEHVEGEVGQEGIVKQEEERVKQEDGMVKLEERTAKQNEFDDSLSFDTIAHIKKEDNEATLLLGALGWQGKLREDLTKVKQLLAKLERSVARAGKEGKSDGQLVSDRGAGETPEIPHEGEESIFSGGKAEWEDDDGAGVDAKGPAVSRFPQCPLSRIAPILTRHV